MKWDVATFLIFGLFAIVMVTFGWGLRRYIWKSGIGELVKPRLVDSLLAVAALLLAGQAIVMYTTEGGWTWLIGAVPCILVLLGVALSLRRRSKARTNETNE
jgi:hypothetical protein